MKLAKKFTAAALIAAMALIAGCGGGADKKAATPSGAKVTLKNGSASACKPSACKSYE